MRKSARATRKPELFQPSAAAGGSARRGAAADPATDDESDGEGDGSDSDDAEREEPVSRAKGRGKTEAGRGKAEAGKGKGGAVGGARAARRVSIREDGGAGPAPGKQRGNALSGNALFDCVAGSRKVSAAAFDWARGLAERRVERLAEMVNFLLLSAGAGKEWLRADVDLEALDAEEIAELLTEAVQALTRVEASAVLPLSVSPRQKMKAFRARFAQLFHATASCLLAPAELGLSAEQGYEALRALVSLLTSLSAMQLACVRLAVTLALLSLALALQENIVAQRAQRELTSRQLAAEGRASSGSAKWRALNAQQAEYARQTAALEALADELFAAVFVHRYKDSAEEVRALCAAHLGAWLSSDPAQLLRDEHLKYLGWLCFDPAADVRLAALGSVALLLDATAHLPKLANFIERFADRLVEMARGDVSEAVALQALRTLRRMQTLALLDEALSEAQLDLVDEVVFDAGASLAVRSEALAFVFAHTEGFEEEPRDAQRAALQLETVAEFVEHHLGAQLAGVRLFVEAGLRLPQRAALTDWPQLVSLLLREGDSATDLSEAHTSVLVHLLACSAAQVRAEGAAEAQALGDCLFEDLPRLLSRFRAGEGALVALLGLLDCYDTAAVNAKQFRPVLKVVGEALEASTSAAVLRQVSLVLRSVCRDAEHLRGVVDAAVGAAVRAQWSIMLRERAALSEGKGRRGARGDSLSSLCFALARFAALWQNHDCRASLGVALPEALDELAEMAEACSGSARAHPSSAEVCALGCRSAARSMYLLLLWSTRDVYVRARGLLGSGAPAEEAGEEEAGEQEALVLGLRDKLLEALHSWLEADGAPLDAELALEAFRVLGDLRVLYSPRNAAHRVVSALAWTPAPALVDSMRKVFEGQSRRLLGEMEALGDSEEERAAGRALSVQLVQGLLCPMGIATMYNMESLSVRQAAAVLNHAADDDDGATALLRAWSKKLRDFDPVKFLEVQLVALRQRFVEGVLGPQREDEEGDPRLVDSGYAALEKLASRLTQSYGPSKWKGDSLVALVNFLKLSVDFSLSDALHLGFVRAAGPYLRLLPAPALRGVGEHLERRLAEHPELLDELADKRNASAEVRALSAFRAAASGESQKRLSRRRRSSMSSVGSESQASEATPVREVAAPKRAQSSRAAARASSALDRVEEVPDDASVDRSEEEEDAGAMLSPAREAPPSTPRSEVPWSSAAVDVQFKYSSRAASDKGSVRTVRSDTSSEVQASASPLKRTPPDFALGLHIEGIEVSPIASDESVVRSAGRERSKRKAAETSEPGISDEAAERLASELRAASSRRRRS